MGEWQDRQIGCGALFSLAAWIIGLGLIVAAIVETLAHPWANLGSVLFMAGCLRTLLGAFAHREHEVRNAYELGRDSASLRVLRD